MTVFIIVLGVLILVLAILNTISAIRRRDRALAYLFCLFSFIAGIQLIIGVILATTFTE